MKEKFVLRSKIVSCIRKFLSEKGFLEVDTPILQTIPGGANARPFISHHNALNIDMYMRIALELPLKKLIIGGFDKVYEMGRVFRNEGVSIKHNPEFTLLELYQAYADYHDMMDLTEELFRFIAKDVFGTYKIKFADMEIDFEKPFERITISGIELRLRVLGRRLNIVKVHPHKFRRTLATMAIDKGMPIEQLQRLLGHQRIDTTLQYAMVKQSNVKLAHKKFIG